MKLTHLVSGMTKISVLFFCIIQLTPLTNKAETPFRNIFEHISKSDIQKYNSHDLSSNVSKLHRIQLKGIIWDDDAPVAILQNQGNQQIVNIGQTIKNNQILDIDKDKILIEQQGNILELKIGEHSNL
ncbi:MAG: hypothetical protein VW378_07985 [bacterium]